MAYKDILVHLDDGPAGLSRVEAAVALAERQEARVTGIAIALESTISSYIGISYPKKLLDEQRELVETTAKSAVEQFEKLASDAGVDYRSEIIRSGASTAPAMLSYFARHADLNFLGQPDPSDPGAAFQQQLLDEVLFNSGRPVYVVPYIGRRAQSLRKTVVAWDGGKKSARAVNDAIALLKDRGETVVLMINPDERYVVHGSTPGEDIVGYLDRHGIKATLEVLRSDELAPDTLMLNFLADSGADLMVMGAYGHSRIRERAFGGVTETIMHQMTTPVLMTS